MTPTDPIRDEEGGERMFDLDDFVAESNRIEGIARAFTWQEKDAHEQFLALSQIAVADLVRFVSVVAPRKPLRDRAGLNVRVGRHVAPPGGPEILRELAGLLIWANDATKGRSFDCFTVHQKYETLHPFMDGNGRSGRVLWLWMMGGIERAPLGFLHHWYYQSLENRVKP